MEVSSIHAASMSRVSTLETPNLSSPPTALLKRRRAILSCLDQGSASVTLSAGFLESIPFAQPSIMRFWPSPSHRSAKPSEARMRNRGLWHGWLDLDLKSVRAKLAGEEKVETLSSSITSRRRCVISGSAVIYGGDWFRTRNSSQGEVLWKPGKRL